MKSPWRSSKIGKSTLTFWLLILGASALCLNSLLAHALFVSPPKDPIPIIKQIFSAQSVISDKAGDPPIRTITLDGEIVGYAFETNDIAAVPAYSGEPVNMLVAIDPEGNYLGVRVLEHHEPIILAGIPESKLDDFATQYQGLDISNRIKVGGSASESQEQIDGLSGATVTVRVMNVAVTRAANIVGVSLGLIDPDQQNQVAMATVKADALQVANWQGLTGDGSIRRLTLSREAVDEAFAGTEAENVDVASAEQKQDTFAEIYYAQVNLPHIGRNLLGEREFNWLQSELKPGEHAIILLGNGYSFKGSGYVRGAIFDRISLQQGSTTVSFRDVDHYRVFDLALTDAPSFNEMSMFIIRDGYAFNPGQSWQFELLVRRQTGPLDSIFVSFRGDYDALDRDVDRPPPPPELTLTEQVWQDKQVEVIILIIAILVLVIMLFFQDILVKHPTFMNRFRHGYLIFTVVFIGWVWAGQLSVVNVFTFLQAFMDDFSWDLFLLDPVIFILWVAVAMTMLLWGRAVYCGWWCPFGALQELVNTVARYFKVKQYELPYAVHERLWAIKYLVLLALFGISLDSLSMAEKYAEVEPFKTTFLLKFDRELPFILWASLLIVVNIVNRKPFCRYLCPLGAALSVPAGMRLFSWLKRRKECGQPCQTCAKECEIQAIEPNGNINMRECHYCLDCQMTYFNEEKCPPLKKMAYKKRKEQEVIPVEVTG